MQDLLTMSSTYTTLNGKRGTPYNTRLGSGDPLIQQPRSPPPSTPISTIPKYPYSIRNHQPAQASNARIPRPDDSTELEVSAVASSTLPLQTLASSKTIVVTSFHSINLRGQFGFFFFWFFLILGFIPCFLQFSALPGGRWCP